MTDHLLETATFTETLDRIAAVEQIRPYVPAYVIADALIALWKSFRSSSPTDHEVGAVLIRSHGRVGYHSLFAMARDAWGDRDVSVEVHPHSVRFSGAHLTVIIRDRGRSVLYLTDGDRVEAREVTP